MHFLILTGRKAAGRQARKSAQSLDSVFLPGYHHPVKPMHGPDFLKNTTKTLSDLQRKGGGKGAFQKHGRMSRLLPLPVPCVRDAQTGQQKDGEIG